MAKKNLGRVKRYRSSFYRNGGYRMRRLVTGLVVLAVIFAVGWMIGPAVIDFGTRTWYDWKNGGPEGPSVSEPVVTEPSSQPEITATPTPTPTPTPDPSAVDTSGGMGYVTLSSIASESAARETAKKLADEGLRYAVITLKDEQGNLYYKSAQELAAGSVTATTIDGAAAVRILKEEGIIPVAGLYMYRDPVAPYTDTSRTAAIHYEDTDYFWLDAAAENGGKPWLNPYSDLAFQYLDGLLDEVEAMGFDHMLLCGVQYPNGVSARCNFGDTAGVSKPDQLANLIHRWQEDAAEKHVTVWFEYPLRIAGFTGEGGSAQLGGGTPDSLGIENLIISLPDEQNDQTQAQLEAARKASAGAKHRMVRSGSRASFDN